MLTPPKKMWAFSNGILFFNGVNLFFKIAGTSHI